MPRIIPREEWGARYPDGFGDRSVGHLDKWLHHTAGAVGTNEHETMRALEHTGQVRFSGGISYTYVVFPSGNIYQGHSIHRVGSHTFGRNSTSAGICLVGNYENLHVTPEQEMSLAWLLNHGVDTGKWRLNTLTGGHRNIKATACPGRNAYARIPYINDLADQIKDAVPVDNPVPIPVPPPPLPPAPPLKPVRNVEQTKATQRAVHVPDDGYWGQDTEVGVNTIRGAINNQFPWGVRHAQARVGAATDGIWGPRSRAALSVAIKRLQAAWGVEPDGIWKSLTEAAWVAARERNYNNW